MRFILDSHPDMACGPETNVATPWGLPGDGAGPGIAELVFKTAHERGGPGPPRPHRQRAKGDGQGREVIIAADPAAWLGLVEGRANLVTELRANRLRYYDPNRKGFLRFDALRAAATLLGIAKISTLHTPQRREPAAVNGA